MDLRRPISKGNEGWGREGGKGRGGKGGKNRGSGGERVDIAWP